MNKPLNLSSTWFRSIDPASVDTTTEVGYRLLVDESLLVDGYLHPGRYSVFLVISLEATVIVVTSTW